jgi:hypothetical protein
MWQGEDEEDENIVWQDVQQLPHQIQDVMVNTGLCANVNCSLQPDVLTGTTINNNNDAVCIDGRCYLKEILKNYFNSIQLNAGDLYKVPHTNRDITWKEYFEIFPYTLHRQLPYFINDMDISPPRNGTPPPSRPNSNLDKLNVSTTARFLGGKKNKKNKKSRIGRKKLNRRKRSIKNKRK